jgi:hypothetical protein
MEVGYGDLYYLVTLGRAVFDESRSRSDILDSKCRLTITLWFRRYGGNKADCEDMEAVVG